MSEYNSRQTAFPGIIIESIRAETSDGGKELVFEEGLPEDIPSDRIKSFFDSIKLFQPRRVQEHRIVYTLQVAAYTSIAAKAKSRSFVRFKNPFSPNIVGIASTEKLKDLGVLRAGRNAYRVIAVVEK